MSDAPLQSAVYAADEADLLRRLRDPAAERMAFRELVKRYQERLYWVIRRMVHSHEDTNDLLQEVFIKVWKGLPSFNGHSSLYTWLYRIAVNETLGFLRREKWRHLVRLNDPAQVARRRLRASVETDGEAVLQQLHEALLQLSPQQRAVFNLRYFDDLPFKEIAQIMGRSESTVKVHYHLARKKVEEILTKS